jgi:glycosyltransferase involved in cell wall biosynthesis
MVSEVNDIDQRPLSIEFYGLNLSDFHIALMFGGMYRAFADALRRAGSSVKLNPGPQVLGLDVVITSTGAGTRDIERVAMNSRSPIVLYVPSASEWFDRAALHRYKDRILFAYGTDCSDLSKERYASVGLPYHFLPFGTDPSIMRPLKLKCEPLYDFVFAAKLGHRKGSEKFTELMMRDRHQFNHLFILGSGGEKFDVPLQPVTWGPVLNLCYNISRVGLNYHAVSQKTGIHERLDLNNRVFDLAAAGCFQVVDSVAAVRQLFGPDEVVAFDEPDEWIDAALYYLRNPELSTPYKKKARERVLAEHTWDHRARQFSIWIQEGINEGRCKPRRISMPIRGRARDGATAVLDAMSKWW